MTNGIQIAGDRYFKVYRGKYKIEIPLKSIDTTINALFFLPKIENNKCKE